MEDMAAVDILTANYPIVLSCEDMKTAILVDDNLALDYLLKRLPTIRVKDIENLRRLAVTVQMP
ncbi:Hypothetical protein POVR2_LOCUS405 [uncultured virus]|nr:Hypothetical protein POVR2_LOCUS405 [uncultured virus]